MYNFKIATMIRSFWENWVLCCRSLPFLPLVHLYYFLCSRNRREAFQSCCQEIQEVWLGADAAVMRQRHVWKERLWGSWQSSALVGGPVGEGQNLSKSHSGLSSERGNHYEGERKRDSGVERIMTEERKWVWQNDSTGQQTFKRAQQGTKMEKLSHWLNDCDFN